MKCGKRLIYVLLMGILINYVPLFAFVSYLREGEAPGFTPLYCLPLLAVFIYINKS